MYKDIERKLATIAYSQQIKNDIDKVLNFYYQVSEMGLKVKNAGALQIRLKWYMGAIEKLYNNENTESKEINNLQKIIKEYKIPQEFFMQIIKAKVVDADQNPFNSFNSALNYSKQTSGGVWKIIALIINKKTCLKDLNKIEQTGTLFGLIGILRNARLFRAYERDLLNYNGNNLNHIEVYSKNTKEICDYVVKNLNQIGKLNNKKLNKLLILNIFTKFYAKDIKAKKYDVLNHEFYKVNKTTLLKVMFYIITK